MIPGTKLLFTLWKISVQKQVLLSWLLLPLQLKIFGFPVAFLEGNFQIQRLILICMRFKPAFKYSKLTMETSEQLVKSIQS